MSSKNKLSNISTGQGSSTSLVPDVKSETDLNGKYLTVSLIGNIRVSFVVKVENVTFR